MQIPGHLNKVVKLNRLRARLDPLDDFELWFWATMMSGTHAVNAALHRCGVTDPVEAYAMQPGVYLVPQPDGRLVPKFGALGDVLHVGRPVIEAPVPEDVAQMMHAMERIEEHRDPCVREGCKPTPEIIDACAQAHGQCMAVLNRLCPLDLCPLE
ncbi:conserved hypothetical protein [Verminephrobacter eiseniae EF01-2]|uniref:Uncharacterized protein n=1 Tax=Verminephrobacter eiseniae (strain EF01-2) TaxID=391735 RepID=A1WPF8_VEREI|nr:hypothetical protein [Verminephrobacter eiseniae]ABM59515.1 conserved hypothetical protein [Verminephrobacter eiseniae EF01-2]